MAPGAAAERVRVARRLHDSLPETRDAFAAGEIGYAHVRVIVRAVDSSEACEETIAEAEPILVEVARDCDPVGLRRVAEHWKHMVDAEGFTSSERDRYDRRRLHLSTILDGMGALDGLFDAEGTATIRSAVEAFAIPLPGDTRTPTQRRADGLVEACRRALGRGDAPMSGGERPHLNITVPLETLERRAGAPAADVGWVEQPISGEAARRLACRRDQPHHHEWRKRAARRRPPHARDPLRAAASGDRTRPALRRPRVRPSAGMVRGAPSSSLARRR